MENSPYLGQSLRSPAQVMEDLRLKHPGYLTQIHSLLTRAEELAQRISDEHGGCTAVNKSFEDLAEQIGELRADYLAPADRDLKEWQKARGEI